MKCRREEGDDEGESFSNFGQEPGFVPAQQQPFVPRDNNHSATISARATALPARPASAARTSSRQREHRPQPQYQPQPQPQPVIADAGSVDRLPSFITGPQPQINGGPAASKAMVAANASRAGAAGRTARAPTSMAAPAAPSDDFNPGNE